MRSLTMKELPENTTRPRRGARALIWALALLAVVAPAPAPGDTELVLIDGRVLRGTEVRLDDGAYVLTLEDGGEIALPQELVEGVRLTGAPEPKREMTPDGLHVAEPQELGGGAAPDGPTGLRSDGPRTLAGKPVAPPRTSEQLEALGKPARFQRDIVDSDWKPESDWEMDPEKNNNFAPSTWAQDVIDPNWKPKSAFDEQKDVMENSRSTFGKSVVDSSWEPTDGFKKSSGWN